MQNRGTLRTGREIPTQASARSACRFIWGWVKKESAHLGICADPDVDHSAPGVRGRFALQRKITRLVDCADHVLATRLMVLVSNLSSTRPGDDVCRIAFARQCDARWEEVNVVEELVRKVNAPGIGGRGQRWCDR